MTAERHWRRIHDYRASGNIEAARVACMGLAQARPHDVDAWRVLAEIEAARGRYRAAHAAALRAADVAASARSYDRLTLLTMVLLGFDERRRVRSLIGDADWDAPGVLRQGPVLAQHLSLADDDAAALRFCGHLAPRLAPDARLDYIEGLAARNLGDGDRAEHAFERAIGRAPAFPPAHWSLAYHRPLGRARLPRLVDAMAAVAPGSPDAVDLAYALYRENEHAGDVDAAWQWLEQAARWKSALLGAADTEWAVPRIEPVPAPAATEPVGLVFVVGLPRSGTTVLERMLGNHPGVHAAGELNAFHAALCGASDAFLSPPSATRAAPSSVDLEDVGARYRASIAGQYPGGRIVIDKNPANFLYAPLIARALPEARILCLRRAPMDACFSNLRELFEGEAYGYSYAADTLAAQYAWFDGARAAFTRALPGRFLTVDYEALVADPRAGAERVLAFCGLDYRDGIERIERNVAPVSTASSSQVREAVHGRGVGAWTRYRAQLDPLRRALIEAGVAP